MWMKRTSGPFVRLENAFSLDVMAEGANWHISYTVFRDISGSSQFLTFSLNPAFSTEQEARDALASIVQSMGLANPLGGVS